MKSVYKRSILKMLWALVGAPIGGLIVGGLSTYFLSQAMGIALGVFITLVLVYMNVFSDDIKFEVEGTKFRYFKRNKLVKEYELIGAQVRYNIKQSNTADDMNLHINGDTIDCAPLGLIQFKNMYYEIEKLTGVKQKIVVGGKKDE
ncbi:hypothetical protein HP397_02500 [Streptobacillus felis]|uniref:DUF304 domain-containing protein n=1 Tax=Streptobacillus felis TaxID=1384509 RepID=A0A7Z0TBT1_9FUSO|nr:hypothetical protein [Streptobacillus felis]NYV27698.1 hypothetical protein [Streptobacillus felis]